jgi:hypothetical protein
MFTYVEDVVVPPFTIKWISHLCRVMQFIFLAQKKVMLYLSQKNKNIYKCDKRYHIDSIIEMYEDEYKFGVAMLTGKEYRMYIVTKSGIHIEPKLITSDDHEMQKQTKKEDKVRNE